MPNTTQISFANWQKKCQQRVIRTLEKDLPNNHHTTQLFAAMRYSSLSPGKRLRPCLVYATGELFAIETAIIDKLAATLEIVHVYSLIHDDLPAMDDDDLRRGQPTCHKAYDEAIAILAGDALQVLAFEWLCELPIEAPIIIKLCSALSKTLGATGMAQGQALDMHWSKPSLSKPTLSDIQETHRLKTGMLFSACIEVCLIVSQNKTLVPALRKFAHHIGIAFQIKDDILDITGDQEIIGKPLGSDQKSNKLTYPSLIGLEQSEQQCKYHYEQALKCLTLIESQIDNDKHTNTTRLMELAQHMIYPNP